MKSLLFRNLNLFAFFSFWASIALANNLEITNVTYNEANNSLNFDISWDNAFYIDSDWSDHVYIFAKYKNANGSGWERVMFEDDGHFDNSPTMKFTDASNSVLIDGKRFAVMASHEPTFTSGTQSGNCTAFLADNIDFMNPSFKVFGIEMIKISTTGNDYYLGDGVSPYRWHRGDDTTEAYFWEYDFFATATVGTGPNDINTTHPDGIPVSSISSDIFRPTNNIMKYEISQIQYVEFLNSLNRTAQNNRVATDISGTSVTDVFVMTGTPNVAIFSRNGIRCDATLPAGGPITFYCDYNDNGVANEYDDGQNIAMNYISGEDLFAYLDWAGLEPINEMEYEQICRGSYLPIPNEYAWGTSNYTNAVTSLGSTYGSPDEFITGAPINGPLRSSQHPMRCGAAATSTTDRVTSGAGAYGHMDLSGNAAELVIALRSAASFNFYVEAPDGILELFGNSDEPWIQEVVSKGFYKNVPGDVYTVSQRSEILVPFTARIAFYGGRGGY